MGQFIDHDLTFDPTSLGETFVDPLALFNYRTPKFDLDSVYGEGPSVQPYLYQRSGQNQQTTLFEIGSTRPTTGLSNLPSFPNDLPRSLTGFALIGDLRNDENLIVAQLHLAFLKFHNKVVTELEKGTIHPENIDSSSNKFEIARKIVVWHYQWLVLHDFLPKIIDREQLDIVLKEGRSFYQYQNEPFIPVEFSVAAFRLGHTMIRSQYNYNRIFSSAILKNLFEFTGSSNSNLGEHKPIPIPSNWIIDWHRFFDFKIDNFSELNFSRKINPFLVEALKNLAISQPTSLAVRNLLRGWSVGLPSGQAVADFMGLKPLTKEEIATGSDGKEAQKHNLHIQSPLWYYILKEAEVQKKGKCLGQVGSRIIAEVFVGLLQGDASSFMVQDKNWIPILPRQNKDNFTILDLLNIVDNLNPIEN